MADSSDKEMSSNNSNNSSNAPLRLQPRTVKVGNVEHAVVEVVRTKGVDVEEGDYPVILVNGMRKPVVSGEIRHFSAHGNTIRAAHNKEVVGDKAKGQGNELPEGAVVLTPKTVAVLQAIGVLTGSGAAQVIEESLPMIAQANEISEALLARIVARVAKSADTQI